MSNQFLSEIRGEISTETVSCMYVEWKVPYDLLLSQNTDCRIHSPSFQFNCISWYLRLKIYARRRDPYDCSSDYVGLYLVKSNAAILTSRVNYHIGIKTAGERLDLQNRDEYPSRLEVDLDCWGADNFCNKIYILVQSGSLPPNDIITFFCYFWMERESLSPVTRKKLRYGQSRMTSTQLLSENTGEISSEIKTIMYVEWKVPDIRSLHKDTKHYIRSSDFQLKDETWYLQATIHETEVSFFERNGPIDFHLVRKDCTTQILHVDYKIGIKNINGNIRMVARDDSFIRKKLKCKQLHWKLSRLDEDIIRAPNGKVTFFFWLLVERAENAGYKMQTEEDKKREEERRKANDELHDGYAHLTESSESDAENEESEEECSNSGDELQEMHLRYAHSNENSKCNCCQNAGLEKLGMNFKNLFFSGEDSDVTFRVKDKEFKAHKCILRARSTIFHSMFSHDIAENSNGIIEIPDFDPDAFEIFLLYLYSGSMEKLSINTVFDLFRAADKYDTEELKLKCKEVMVTSLSVDTVCDVIEHCLQNNEVALLLIATEFFTRNCKNIVQTVKWQSFMKKRSVEANALLIKAFDCHVLKE